MQQIVEKLLSSSVSIFTALIFVKIVTNAKSRLNVYKIISYFVFTIIFALNSLYCTNIYKTVINFIIHIFFFKTYFNLKISQSVFVSFIYAILLMIPDMIILLFFVGMFGMTKEYCYNIFAGSFIGNLLVCAIILLITYLLRNKLKRLFSTRVENSNNILYMTLFTILCVIILFFDIITNYKNDNSIFSYIMLIIIFLIVISNLIKEKITINDKIKEYNSLLAFMRTYEIEIESNRIQNHEIKNQFITIVSMLKDNEKKDKILNYVSNLVKDYKNIDDNKYSDLQYLPLNGLKGFICNKINKAESENINVSVIIEKGIQNSIIANLKTDEFKKLGILLGVYLDNAIEATVVTKDKSLSIEMYVQNGDVLIIISNTFNNEIIYDNDSNKFKTTKGVGHGYGLQLVSKVLNNSKKFIVSNYMQSNVFIQKIIVKK